MLTTFTLAEIIKFVAVIVTVSVAEVVAAIIIVAAVAVVVEELFRHQL